MIRSTTRRFTTNGSWVAPAGVTNVLVVPDGGVGLLISVTPNTSYAIVAATAPGSFGSLLQFKTNSSTGYLTLFWMDG